MAAAAAAAKLLQLWPTLCDPIDGSPPGFPVPGILQARTLEWVAISFSNAWTWKVKVKSLSRVWLLATSWTAAYQAPPSMRFSRQEKTICNSLNANDGEHLFLCLFAIHFSSLIKCLLRFWIIFKLDDLFSYYWVLRVLFIFQIIVLYQIYILQILSCTV